MKGANNLFSLCVNKEPQSNCIFSDVRGQPYSDFSCKGQTHVLVFDVSSCSSSCLTSSCHLCQSTQVRTLLFLNHWQVIFPHPYWRAYFIACSSLPHSTSPLELQNHHAQFGMCIYFPFAGMLFNARLWLKIELITQILLEIM